MEAGSHCGTTIMRIYHLFLVGTEACLGAESGTVLQAADMAKEVSPAIIHLETAEERRKHTPSGLIYTAILHFLPGRSLP